ncbi:MAG: DpnI domain-containing protein, partial [Candidatus Hydrothermarchaeales archaeon]
YFMTPSLVEERRPLNSTARRSGWIGSNILLGNLPLEARIGIVASGVEIPKNTVRAEWNRFLFLRDQSISSRGWLSDILKTVRMLNNKIFTLEDVYTFESDLAVLHPHNKHIRPKIRQQLQLLRNKGVVEFLGRGRYRLKD